MKPYFSQNGITIYHGDCRDVLPALPQAMDMAIADPPYGETSLKWDKRVDGCWPDLMPCRTLWCFGSLRFFMQERDLFTKWKLAQDIVWKKHNGSGFHADRFRRVHEHIVQFYKGEWATIFKKPVTTPDATPRTRRSKTRPPHLGHIDQAPYVSVDGGPRLQRSVIEARSCHHYAQHPTQKPIEIILPLIEYSCPPNGIVLDPFMGSGTTLVAARQLNRKAVGIENQERYCEIAARRIQSEA